MNAWIDVLVARKKIAVWLGSGGFGQERGISMRRIAIRCFGLMGLVFCLSCACLGQNTTGTISGTVSDSKGGVVPNVKVTVTNADQQVVVRTVTTDERGE
jgi:hypothetical protein